MYSYLASQLMKHAQQKDLTVGTPWKVLLLFTLPIFLGNLIQMVYTWTDGVFLGQIGEESLAAASAAGSIIYPATIFAQGLPIGLGNYTSQLFGAKDEKGVRHSYGVSIIIVLVAGLVLTLAALLLVPSFLKAGNIIPGTAIYDYAKVYMYIMLGGLLGALFMYFYQNFLRAIGDSSLQFWTLAVYTALNILLDFLFIFVGHLGVMGCALAYVISTVLASVISYFWVYFKYPEFRLHKEDFKCDSAFVKAHLKIAVPLAAQFSILAIGVMVMQGAVDGYGTDAINGYFAGSKVDNLLCTFIVAYGYALGAYCGQNYGAKQYKRVKDGITQAFIAWGIQTLILMLVTFLVKDVAASFFLSNPTAKTVEYCRIYLYWDIVGYACLGLIYLGRNALSGIGKSSVSFISGVTEMVLRIVGSLAFAIPFGVVAALGAQSMAWIGAGLVNLFGLIICIYANPLFKKNELTEKETTLPQRDSSIVK